MSAESRVVKLLCDLVAVPTENPPGQEAAAAHLIEKWFKPYDLEIRRYILGPGRVSLTVLIPGKTTEAVAFCGHLDTVPAVRDQWTKDPFVPQIEGDRVYGLGAADMKGGVASIIAASIRFLESGFAPHHSVMLIFTADEEGMMGGAQTLRSSLKSVRFLVIAEPTNHSVYYGERGQYWVRMDFLGRGSHGATPQYGNSALLAACEAARMLEEWSLSSGVRGITVNIGTLKAGDRINAVPSRATMEIDMRYSDRTQEHILASLFQNTTSRLTSSRRIVCDWRLIKHLPPIVGDKSDEYFRLFSEAASPHFLVSTELAPYATDAQVLVGERAIPFAICGPGSIAQAHAPDEYVEISDLSAAEEAFYSFLRKL